MPVSASNKDDADDYSAGDRDNDDQQQQQASKGGRKEEVQFACLNRSSPESRRLQRQAHRGVIVDIQEQKPSFVQNVQQPLRCVQDRDWREKAEEESQEWGVQQSAGGRSRLQWSKKRTHFSANEFDDIEVKSQNESDYYTTIMVARFYNRGTFL